MADKAYSIQQTLDGGYIVTGESLSSDGNITNSHGQFDYWVLKLDISGNIAWQKCYGGSAFDRSKCIKQTIDGGYVITGTSSSNDGDVINSYNSGNAWIVRLDTSGNILWQKKYGSHTGIVETSYSICQALDGGFAVAGISFNNGGDVTGNHGGSDYWIIKLDAAGNLIWQKSLGGSVGDEPFCTRQANDGGFIVVGRSASTDGDVTGNHGVFDVWVVKLSPAGVLEWQKAMGGVSTGDYGYGIWQTTDEGFIVAGMAGSNNTGDVGPNHGGLDYWVIKLGPEVVPITLLNFDGTASGKDVLCKWKTAQEQNSSHFVIERSEDALHFKEAGKVTAAGNSVLPIDYYFVDQNVIASQKEYLFYRLKLVDLDGSFKFSNVVEVKLKQPAALNVYPNPVVNLLNIEFIAGVTEKATLTVSDFNGENIYKEDIYVKEGKNHFSIGTSSFPAKTYVVYISGNKKRQAIFSKVSK